MNKKIVFILGGLIISISLYIAAGFDIQIEAELPLYASRENVPLSERALLTNLKSGEQVSSIGCFDNKSDIFFYVALQDGRAGYIYDFKFTAQKRLLPRLAGLRYFLEDPIASLQCLIMVPEYSRT